MYNFGYFGQVYEQTNIQKMILFLVVISHLGKMTPLPKPYDDCNEGKGDLVH